MKLKFLGASQTVTGSKYLLTIDDKRYLFDCGLFQGNHDLRRLNWNEFPIDPSTINAVILTHAHIDHSGYLPLLVKHGFRGRIYATNATFDLCKILLPDSGFLHEEEARMINKYGYSKHKPALPLYTLADAEESLKYFHTVPFDQEMDIAPHFKVTWRQAGHILGAAFLEVRAKNKTLLFTGDLGRVSDPILYPPEHPPKEIDYLITESTYGNRLHPDIDPKDVLEEMVNETYKKGGTVLIPAFAVGRAQTILYYLDQLKKENKIPNLPIYLDSPMAINATELLCKHAHLHKLSKDSCTDFTGGCRYVHSQEESRSLNSIPESKIIISASGMVTGGRVLHHFKLYAPDARNTILLTGFQAPGTRGAIIESGHGNVKVFGEIVQIHAKVVNISNISAHVDYSELLEWLKPIDSDPQCVFITHGEKAAAEALQRQIENERHWKCVIPEYQESFDL